MSRVLNIALNEEKIFGSINPTEGGELRARPVFKTIRHNSLMEARLTRVSNRKSAA